MRSIIGLVLIAIVVIVVIVFLLRRRKGDEIHSIERYRDALGTLGDMRGNDSRSYIRVLSPDEQRSARQPGAPEVLSAPRRAPIPIVAPDDGLIFDDQKQEAPSSEPSSQTRHHGEPEWALDRMIARTHLQHRRLIAAGVAVALIALLIIVGVVIAASPSHHQSIAASTTTTTTGKSQSTTTTTLATLSAVTQTANGASYVLPGATTITATVAVTTQCWTIATQDPGNKQIYAAVIMPNQPISLNATGSLSISVAAPSNVSVVVNGLKVVMPQHLTIPTVLTFKATTPPLTTTTSTSTSTTTTTLVP